MNIAELRMEYARAGLDLADLEPDPFRQFAHWFEINAANPSGEANAMTLSTATAAGFPSSRIVLLKGFDGQGFRFFSNYRSRKGREIEANPHVALTFHWYGQERQVNVQGVATRTSADISRTYFDSRPKGSRFGAMVSEQSTVVPDRATLEAQLEELAARYAESDPPLPENWGGYEVRPIRFEFWQGRPNRLHDRFQYRRADAGHWVIERLAP